MISKAKKSLIMKTLEFVRDEKKDRVTVACADGMVSVYSKCAYLCPAHGVHGYTHSDGVALARYIKINQDR